MDKSMNDASDQQLILRAAEILVGGGLVIMPTDTVYGVAAHPRAAEAVQRLYDVKGRDAAKPIAMLAASPEAVERYGATMTGPERTLAARYWPGALTLVLEAGGIAEGFRVPDHATALALLETSGGVLRVTSANRSGEPPALTAEEASRAIGAQVDEVIDAGPVPGGVPSTVVRVTDGRPRILREGALTEKEILETCGESV